MIFCERCENLVLKGPSCSCGWTRPSPPFSVSERIGDPWVLKKRPAGTAVVLNEMAWYATPPKDRDSNIAGDICSIDLNTGQVTYYSLAQTYPSPSIPVLNNLDNYQGNLITAAMDYTSSPQDRPKKKIHGRSAKDGRIIWQVPVSACYLKHPVISREQIYVITSTPSGVCAVQLRDTKAVRWHVTTQIEPDSYFVPALTTQTVFVLSGNRIRSHELVALDAESGQIRWRTPMERGCKQPVTVGEFVIVPHHKGVVAFHEHENGRATWSYTQARSGTKGFATAPLVVTEEFLLLATNGEETRPSRYELHAVNRHNGKRIWCFVLPEGSKRISIEPLVVANQFVVIGNGIGQIFVLDLKTGEVLWSTMLRKRLVAQPFMDHRGILYVPTRDYKLHRFQFSDGTPMLPHRPEFYQDRGQLELAANAYALTTPPDLISAAKLMERLGEIDHSLRLWRMAGSHEAVARISEQEGNSESTIIPSDYGLQTVVWRVKINDIQKANELLERLIREKKVEPKTLHERLLDLYNEAEIDEDINAHFPMDKIWQTCAQQFEEQNDWEMALSCYQQIDDSALMQAHCLAQMGHLEEAGDLLSDPEQSYPLTAADYYLQAAKKAEQGYARNRKNREAGRLYQLAAEQFRNGGKQARAEECMISGAQACNDPRLVLENGRSPHQFVENITATIEFDLVNYGGGVAQQIKIYANGSALQMPTKKDMIPVVEYDYRLAAHDTRKLSVPLRPTTSSLRDNFLDVKLWIVYLDNEKNKREDGPYIIKFPIEPNYVSHAIQESSTKEIHIINGNYIGGDIGSAKF